MDQWLERLLGDVRGGQPRDLAGSHAAADLAVTEDLLNRLLAEKLPRDGAVKDLSVRLEAGTARVSVKLTRPAFLPAINMRVTIDRQPELPGSPVLVLRLDMPPGMAALARIACHSGPWR